MNTKKWGVLAGFVLLAQAAGIVGSLVTVPAIDSWYITLVRPGLTPPNWVFGPVWTTLYALMGVAAFLVWAVPAAWPERRSALRLFFAQLFLNTLWSILFFGFHSLSGAFVGVVLLWLAILATTIAFARVSRMAAWLLLPYILWVSFAGYLNLSIWMLNV